MVFKSQLYNIVFCLLWVCPINSSQIVFLINVSKSVINLFGYSFVVSWGSYQYHPSDIIEIRGSSFLFFTNDLRYFSTLTFSHGVVPVRVGRKSLLLLCRSLDLLGLGWEDGELGFVSLRSFVPSVTTTGKSSRKDARLTYFRPPLLKTFPFILYEPEINRRKFDPFVYGALPLYSLPYLDIYPR